MAAEFQPITLSGLLEARGEIRPKAMCWLSAPTILSHP